MEKQQTSCCFHRPQLQIAPSRTAQGVVCFIILFFSLDLVVMKLFQFTESRSIEFRMETFNLFNITNFDLPNRFAFTPNFGKVFSAGPARQIQFGLKLSF